MKHIRIIIYIILLIVFAILFLTSCATTKNYNRSEVRYRQSEMRYNNVIREVQRQQRSAVFPYKHKH